jgi:ureidoacrylate peracid hydrolase
MSTEASGVNLDTPFGPISFDVATTAVIVVDMQNDFASPHGMFARAGVDIAPVEAVVEPTAHVLAAARRAGIPVVYLKMGFLPDLSDTGGPDAPNWFKVHAPIGVGEAITLPDGTSGRILVRDTWNTDIVAELAPDPSDVVVYKTRFSGFYNTELDDALRNLGVRTLVFTGCTTSVCVESTLRDAFFRDYCCVLLEDCVAEPIGHGMPRSNHEATVLLVNLLFGWVCRSDDLTEALDRAPVANRS